MSAWESIQTEGLTPSIGPRSQLMNESVPLIYFFESLQDVETALIGWAAEAFDDEDELLVLKVDLSHLDISLPDDSSFEMVSHQNIPSERIIHRYDEYLNVINDSGATTMRPQRPETMKS